MFIAECPFCRLQLRNVPHERSGASFECPRCQSLFTLAPQIAPRKIAENRVIRAAADIFRPAATDPGSSPTVPPLPGPSQPTPIPPTVSSPVSALPRRLQRRFKVPIPVEPAVSPASSRSVRPLDLAALLLGCLALIAVAIPALQALPLPLSALGVLIGVVGWMTRRPSGRGLVFPVAALAVSLPVLTIAGFWPGLLGLPPWGDGSDEALVAIPLSSLLDESRARKISGRDWIDASKEAVQKGELRLVISAVTVKPAELKDPEGKKHPPKEKYLHLSVRLMNVVGKQRYGYTSWSEAGTKEGEAPRVRDNRDKPYLPKTFGTGRNWVGRLRQANIGPGKPAEDVLIFEMPPSPLDYLRVELPCSAFGGLGVIRFQIPKEMVHFQ